MSNNPLRLFKLSVWFLVGFQCLTSTAFASDPLTELANGQHRSDKYIARNDFRHPVETLNFFGIKADMTVVEISPGGGWYMEILAPYLKDKGQYIAAGYDPESKIKYYSINAKKLTDKIAADPVNYSKVKVTIMEIPDKLDFAPENSADLVLSFRNTHNWSSRGQAENVYAAIYKVVKPGGFFGLVQHRAGIHQPRDTTGKLGYLKTSEIIKMAEKAGFRLVAESEINANLKDTKDYKDGVWTLPPSYRLKDKDRAKYKAIGESDRMTLKFFKPALY